MQSNDRRGRMEEAVRLLQAARSFEELGRVPVLIDGLGGPFLCSLLGYTLADYYRRAEVFREVLSKRHQWVFDVLRDDRPIRRGRRRTLDVGSRGEGIVFDCEIRLPDERNSWLPPWIVPKFRTVESLESLEVPEPKDVMKRFKRHLRTQYGKEIEPWPIQIHPPLSAAGSLIGTDRLYILLYRYPKLMQRFLSNLLETWFLLQEYRQDMLGHETRAIGLCDDHAGFLPENMYRSFVLPYNKAIYDRYGKEWRSLHMDSPCAHIAHILANDFKINEMDIAATEDIAKVKPIFDGKVIMHGNLNSRLLTKEASYKDLKEAVNYCISSAAAGGGYILDVGGELYAGTDPDKVTFMVKYTKKVGKYPIGTLKSEENST